MHPAKLIIFDWGDTLMRDFPASSGPMVHWQKVEVMPGVAGALEELEGKYTLVAASNAGDSDAGLMRQALDRGGIGRFFQHVFTSKELAATKPAPDFFLAICERTGCAPTECIMVGNDYAKDVCGAKAAGMRTIWLSDNPSPPNVVADEVISSMSDLPQALRRLLEGPANAGIEGQYRASCGLNARMGDNRNPRHADEFGIAVPDGFDYPLWISRWDRMQRRYLVRREERFAVMVELVMAVAPTPGAIIDLGCGSGSVTLRLAEAFPQATIIGIDFDPTMLVLARARLARVGQRVQLLSRDLRRKDWTDNLPESIDAAVSATAMHWFSPQQLAGLYKQMAGVMRRGGILLNADHVGSDEPAIQKAWEAHRRQMQSEQADAGADDWTGFWAGYSRALGIDIRGVQERIWAPSHWVEPGMPLAWHFDRLREAGFASVDCFWRCDCDAIYGGICA